MQTKPLKDLARIVSGLRDERRVYEFLRGLLTPQEQERIALRWRIVELLARGVRQRRIAEKLGVSLCKITRGSYELQHGPAGFREVIEEIVGEEAVGKKKRKGG